MPRYGKLSGSRPRLYGSPVSYVYALLNRGELVYIGCTTDVDRRKEEHWKSGKVFDECKVITSGTDRKNMLHEERRLIEEYNPEYNKR